MTEPDDHRSRDTEPPPHVIDVPPPAEVRAELVDEPTEDPPPELVDALVRHYTRKRVELEQQIGNMEQFLGFIEVSSNLAVRVAKLEAFLGLKG
jgi:hypothetical protein